MSSWLHGVMPRWYGLVGMLISTLLLALSGFLYVNYQQASAQKAERENDRRWCQLLITLDQAYSTSPPTSELGRRVALAIHSLRTELGC